MALTSVLIPLVIFSSPWVVIRRADVICVVMSVAHNAATIDNAIAERGETSDNCD